jgi:tRNA-dihydrouridine synthase
MFEGHADWLKIKELKEALRIPVIGSGDIFTAVDVIAMLEETGCDAVMIARGGLGNPWLFREALALMAGRQSEPPTPAERLEVALRHLELFTEMAGEQMAFREMRKHLSWYVRGLAGAAQFRNLINQIEERQALVKALRDFFRQGER